MQEKEAETNPAPDELVADYCSFRDCTARGYLPPA